TMAGRINLPDTLAAKWKTTLQMVAVGCQRFARNWDSFGLDFGLLNYFQPFADTLIWMAAIVTIGTGWQYFSAAQKQMRDLYILLPLWEKDDRASSPAPRTPARASGAGRNVRRPAGRAASRRSGDNRAVRTRRSVRLADG